MLSLILFVVLCKTWDDDPRKINVCYRPAQYLQKVHLSSGVQLALHAKVIDIESVCD